MAHADDTLIRERTALRSLVARAIITVLGSVGLAGLVAWAGAQGGVMIGGVPLLMVCAAIAFAVQWIAFVPSYLQRTEHFYDVTGTVTYLSVTWLAVAQGSRDPRSLVLAGLVSVWALRLGSFLFGRVRRAGKDGRFDAIKTNFARFLVAWTLQGLWVFLTLAAALATLTTDSSVELGIGDAVGVTIWLIGFGVEVVADRQKSAFREQHPERFVDSGLWRLSRHPNYFGEIVLWIGIAVIAASTLRSWQWVTMISPLFVYLLITQVSGIPMLEKRADDRWGERDDYRAYKARTSVLVPRPPRG